MNLNHNHVIDSWIAELGLEERGRRRGERAAAAATSAVFASDAVPATRPADVIAPVRRNYTEPRLVSRIRGGRPSRFSAARADQVRPCLELSRVRLAP